MFTYLFIGVVIAAAEVSKADETSMDMESMLEQPYCGLRYRRLCRGKGRHVACQFPTPGPGDACTNYTKINFDSKLRNIILNYINRRRQRIAAGSETVRGGVRIPQPVIMMQVEWDKELAMLAQRLADQCSFVHDDCRATVRFPYAGQTVGEVKWRWASEAGRTWTWGREGEATGRSAARAVRRVLDAWWGERRRVTVHQLTQPFRLSSKGNDWGHFSQIAVWTLRAVGCGLVRHGSQLSRILMVCDYSHTNMLGQSTVVVGKIAPCPAHTIRRMRTQFPLLCAPVRVAEDVNEDADKDLEGSYEETDDEPNDEPNDSGESVVMPVAPLRDKTGFEVPREEVLHILENGDPTPRPEPVKQTTNEEEDYHDIDKVKQVHTVPMKVKMIGNERHKNIPRETCGVTMSNARETMGHNVMLSKLEQELKAEQRGRAPEPQRPVIEQECPGKHSTEVAPRTRLLKLLDKVGDDYAPSNHKAYTPVSHRWRPGMDLVSPKWKHWPTPKESVPAKASPDYSEAEGVVLHSTPSEEEGAYTRTRWRHPKAQSPRPGAQALPGLKTEMPVAPNKEPHATRVLLKMAKEDQEQLYRDTGFHPSKPKIPVLPPPK